MEKEFKFKFKFVKMSNKMEPDFNEEERQHRANIAEQFTTKDLQIILRYANRNVIQNPWNADLRYPPKLASKSPPDGNSL